MKISILVPCYNVEKYIRTCVDSLLAQDFDDYEIVLINDGSPDNCLSIMQQYQQQHPNRIRVIDKENGGYGSVLEVGIQTANAEYILICDPDDYLAPNALSSLYKQAECQQADIVVSAKYLVYEDSDAMDYDQSYSNDFGYLEDQRLYVKEDSSFETLYFFEPSPHGKLYRRELIKTIQFVHKVSYTDNLLYFYALSKANRVVYLKDAYSYYLINRVGNTRTDIKAKVIDAWVAVFQSILKQVPHAPAIFYFRMYEAFQFIFYKIDQIDGDQTVKLEKYQSLYSLLEQLINHKQDILDYSRKYLQLSGKQLKQRERLLDLKTSQTTYQDMYHKRLSGKNKPLKHRVRLAITKNPIIDRIYQKYHARMKYMYHRNSQPYHLNPNVQMNILGEDTHFFGYYDKPAMQGGYFIYHRLQSSSLSVKQELEICVNHQSVSKTNTWNWQQGSMLSFLDDQHIIHNVYRNNSYQAKIISLTKNEEWYIPFPIYALSHNHSFSLSLNFSRLAKLRADYGYFNLDYQTLTDDNQDGIFYVDLIQKQAHLYLTLENIKSFEMDETMRDAQHKVNHIEISPDDKHAIFLHRWFKNGVKYTRLLLLEIETKKLKKLVGNKMVSHMCFVDNNTLFGYLHSQGKDGFFFVDFNGKTEEFKHPLLTDDGHPTVYQNRYIVVDSYPTADVYSRLYLIDTKTKQVQELGKFLSPYRYQGFYRCDLHPRFNQDGSITIDTVFSGKRQVCHLEFPTLLNK